MKALTQLICIFAVLACGRQQYDSTTMENEREPLKEGSYNELTAEERRVIVEKGTEYPFTGKYNDNKDSGTYLCKRCDAPLFESKDKFNSGSGWPSFDDAIDGAVKEIPDADGRRVEIVCNNCGGHLGHVFRGEGFTDKNTRHCVNSISMNFEPAPGTIAKDTAFFASGCFWGTEYYLKRLPGVLSTEVGYMGGSVTQPLYQEVCTGRTGHAEVVKVEYNPDSVSYETLAKYFFETHDPTQINRQGPDIGTQYRSEIFYTDDEQKEIAEQLIKELTDKGLDVATKVTSASSFWKGEDYHQDYYDRKGGVPYCHGYTKRF